LVPVREASCCSYPSVSAVFTLSLAWQLERRINLQIRRPPTAESGVALGSRAHAEFLEEIAFYE
jgi:hypothetical protein